MEYSPLASSVHGTLQARILEWVAISFSRGSSQPRDWTTISHLAGRLFTDWTTWGSQLVVTKLVSVEWMSEHALICVFVCRNMMVEWRYSDSTYCMTPNSFMILLLLRCIWHLTLLKSQSARSLCHVRLFATLWTAARQASLSITNSRSLLKLMSIESVMPSTISYSVIPFSSCLQSFPASGSFQMSQLFTSGGQSIGVSASSSVLPWIFRIDFF